MNKFNDSAAQRQYFQKLNLALDVRSFPPTFQDSKTFNNLDYQDYRNQAETMLYSNATRMLQLRSEELDRVRDIESLPYNQAYNNINEFQMGSPTHPPPPPPPPHKQEHLNETSTKISKIIRSYAQDSSAHHGNRSRSMKTADEIEAERIKSYNEGANIFKINRIREFTPDFDKQHGNYFNNSNNNNGKPELMRQRSSMDMIAADKIKQKNEAVNAGCYVPNLPQTTGRLFDFFLKCRI